MDLVSSDLKNAADCRLKIIKEWIMEGNIHTRDMMGRTPLHSASVAGDVELAQLFLDNRAAINSLDNENCTPLHVACSNGRMEMVKLLIAHGADVHCMNMYQSTPLHECSKKGYHEIAEYLIESGASTTFNYNYSPLHVAAEYGHHLIASLLLKNNADVDSMDGLNSTPLIIASMEGHLRVVEILLDCGASIDKESLNRTDGDNDYQLSNTAIDVAALNGKRDVITLLLQRGAKIVNSLTTCLHQAAFYGDQSICEDLIKAGADVNAEDVHGSNSLHCARSPETVRYLILQGANVIKNNNQGMSPLHTACRDGASVDVIVALLEEGLDVHATDNRGRSILHAACACHNDMHQKVETLLEWGADFNCRDISGRTPLHLAAKYGSYRTVKLLIERGADINIMCSQNLSAIDYARIRLGGPHVERRRTSLASIIKYLKHYVILMSSVNMYLRKSFLKVVQFKKLNKQCQEELGRLKAASIGNSEITYHKFLRKSIDQIVWTLRSIEIQEDLNSGWFKKEFPNFGILIGNLFNRVNVRKEIIDRVFQNCSEIFSGLQEECVYEILSFLNNRELCIFADSFAEPQR